MLRAGPATDPLMELLGREEELARLTKFRWNELRG